jgi:uroporphyrinogen-III decarboxylase
VLRFHTFTHPRDQRIDQIMNSAHSKFLDLAKTGHGAPIGTHLILHNHSNPDAILRDGRQLGDVIMETADFFKTPMAVPLMDLTLEKEAWLEADGIEEVDSFHFAETPREVEFQLTPRMRAVCEAIARVASRSDLVPMGMGIGPFSLMTKLIADPITPVFLAGSGMDADDEEEVALVERVLELGTQIVLEYISHQVDAGAKAFILCEPAANLVYFSPNQLESSYEIFDRYVMNPLRRIKALLDERNAALVFHDCGELTTGMVERFAGVRPAMASLGSSRTLWEDAARFDAQTVLYGNLPTKRFVSPQLSAAEVERTAAELLERMSQTGHPFILGSECDILSVPGEAGAIMENVQAFLSVTNKP